MSPFFILAMAASAFGPMQSSANATGRFTMRATSAATGLSESFRSNPFGRLRCDSKITLPPLSASSVMVWAISSMRVASATLPSCIGTLRSTRNKTRLPLTSALSRLRKAFMTRGCESLRSDDVRSGELAHRDRGVDHAIGEAPLVVIPRHHAHQRAVQHLGLVHVENAGVRVVIEVAGDVGLLRIAKDALELLLGGAFDRGVDLVLRSCSLGDELEVHH